MSAIKHFKMDPSGYGFQLKTSFARDPEPPIVKLNKLLDIIQVVLCTFTE